MPSLQRMNTCSCKGSKNRSTTDRRFPYRGWILVPVRCLITDRCFHYRGLIICYFNSYITVFNSFKNSYPEMSRISVFHLLRNRSILPYRRMNTCSCKVIGTFRELFYDRSLPTLQKVEYLFCKEGWNGFYDGTKTLSIRRGLRRRTSEAAASVIRRRRMREPGFPTEAWILVIVRLLELFLRQIENGSLPTLLRISYSSSKG